MKEEPFQQEDSVNTFCKTNKFRPGFTNNVLRIQKDNRILYYIPAYLRLKVKNVVSMDLFTLSGEVNCTFILSVFYAKMQPQAIQYLSNSIQMAFHKGDSMLLDEKSLQIDRKINQKKSLISFTIRKVTSAQLQGQIFWSPFETVRFLMSVCLRNLKKKIGDKWYVFKFNLMDWNDIQTKFSLAQQWDFGVFKMADNQLQVQYTNQYSFSKSFGALLSKKKKGKQNYVALTQVSIPQRSKKQLSQIDDQNEPLTLHKSISNFRYAHFVLPMYKKPNPTILTIYFPLLLLGIINIAIFYQDNTKLGKKLINTSALLVSFIALIPTVRQNTAISPVITFTQILVFLQSFTTLLTLGHMIEYRNTSNFTQILQQDGYALCSVMITCFVFACVLILWLLHKFYWKKKYHNQGQYSHKNFKFEPRQWSNKVCDEYFFQEINNIQSSILQWQDPQQDADFKNMKHSLQIPPQSNVRQLKVQQGQFSAQKIKLNRIQTL